MIDARSFCNLIIAFFFCRINNSSSRLSIMGLLVVVVVVAGVMEMTVDVCACCGGAVDVRVWFWGLR